MLPLLHLNVGLIAHQNNEKKHNVLDKLLRSWVTPVDLKQL